MVDKMTASQVVPDELQHELIAYAENMSSGSWGIGDTALVLAEENPGVPKALIDGSVGLFARGLSGSRVRDLRVVCKFYPKDVCVICFGKLDNDRFCYKCEQLSMDIREQFEICSFSHFETAKRAGNYAEAIGWLQVVVESMDDYSGMIMPVDALEAKMAENGDIEPEPSHIKRFRAIRSGAEKTIEDREAPDNFVQAAEEILAILNLRKAFVD